jgi:hypothetical protein
LSFVELARIENDPKPGPLAVIFVITAEALAIEINPPKAKAAMTNLDRLFIVSSMDAYQREINMYTERFSHHFLH